MKYVSTQSSSIYISQIAIFDAANEPHGTFPPWLWLYQCNALTANLAISTSLYYQSQRVDQSRRQAKAFPLKLGRMRNRQVRLRESNNLREFWEKSVIGELGRRERAGWSDCCGEWSNFQESSTQEFRDRILNGWEQRLEHRWPPSDGWSMQFLLELTRWSIIPRCPWVLLSIAQIPKQNLWYLTFFPLEDCSPPDLVTFVVMWA